LVITAVLVDANSLALITAQNFTSDLLVLVSVSCHDSVCDICMAGSIQICKSACVAANSEQDS